MAIYISAGNACLDMQAATAGQLRLCSKRTFSMPFRVVAYVGLTTTGAAGGLATGSEFIMQIRDTAGIVANSIANPTYLARFRVYGAAAGGATVTGAVEIRAGGTSASFVSPTTSGYDPTGLTGLSTCGLRTGMVIDVDYSGISFGYIGTFGYAVTAGNAALPPPPQIVQHVVSPLMKPNQRYAVEFVYSVGTSCVEVSNATATATSGVARIFAVDVRQYTPVGALQRPGPLLTYSLQTTAGGGIPSNTAANTTQAFMKWA
jgi:hypothetical protein